MEKERVVILGGTGFIGRNIREYLSDQYECISVAEESSPFADEKDTLVLSNPYREAVEVVAPTVIHLIDNQSAEENFAEAERQLMENIFTDHLRHVIVFSSAVVYAAPDSTYGQRKKMLERIWKEECQRRGVTLTLLRLFNVYGYYQLPYRQGSVIANIIYNHLTGKPTVINDLKAERDFIFAADIGRFVARVLKEKKEGVFDLASNQLCSLEDMIAKLEAIFGEKIRIEHQSLKEVIQSPVGKNPFLEAVALTPQTVCLQQTVAFYREHREEVETILSKKKS